MCDKSLGYVELIRQLLAIDPYYNVSLLDFNLERATLLRDRLVQDDHMTLAVELCQQCHLSVEPVLSAWGQSLLRIGLYEEAKVRLGSPLASGFLSATQVC